jgi:AraC-like DNA-binding protein
MGKTKHKENHIKMISLKMDSEFDIHSLYDDFSVNIDIQIPEYKAFKNYFRSDFFQLILFKSGKANFSHNLIDYQVTKNDFFTFAPFDIKRINSFDSSIHSIIVFTADFLEKSGVTKIASEVLNYFTSQYSPLWKLESKDADLLNTRFLELAHNHNNVEQHVYGKELLYLSFTIFLYELAAMGNKYAESVNRQPSRKESIVINFTNLLKSHFKTQRSLSFYASKLHITPKYLTVTLKEITGKSAGEIIDSFVIQEARMLLDNRTLSIAQVAEELNFSDQSFFGKFFKRLTGFSPSDYRKL